MQAFANPRRADFVVPVDAGRFPWAQGSKLGRGNGSGPPQPTHKNNVHSLEASPGNDLNGLLSFLIGHQNSILARSSITRGLLRLLTPAVPKAEELMEVLPVNVGAERESLL